MKLSAILAPLIAAGVSGDVILATVKAFEEQQNDALERRRESDRKRQSEKRSRDVTLCHSDSPLTCGGDAPVDVKQITTDTSNSKKEDTGAAKPLSDVEAFKAELAPILDKDRIEALCAVRRKKKATFSAHAGKLLVGKILRFPDASETADTMILRNWVSIEPEWLEGRNKPPAQASPKPKSDFHERQDEIYRNLKRQNGEFDDKFTGPSLDLDERDYRPH